jgi:pimeloyl-ACP methyl ester carboxylesterase
MELFDQIIEIGGVHTHVFKKGEGHPLLWLHGANGNPKWNSFLESLSQNYTVYAPEHPGFGRSSRPVWFKDFEDMVYHYRAFLDYFEIEKAMVIGQSLGGWIAAELAVSQTHRVEKLILTAAAGLWKEGYSKVDTFVLSDQKIMEKLVFDKALAARMLDQLQSEEVQQLSMKNRLAYARLAFDKFFNPKFERILSFINIPTMVIWGEKDEIISPNYAQLYAQYIPETRLRIIPECGHLPYLEKEAEYLSMIHEFLEGWEGF